MSTFFTGLKQKRDVEPVREAPKAEQAPSSGSFFSNLKQKREIPREESPLDEFGDNPMGFKERAELGAKEVGQQSAVGFTSGFVGGWGNAADLLTINPPKDYQHAGTQAHYDTQAEILDKQRQPGYTLSASDIYALSDDVDPTPRPGRLPSSQDVSDLIEQYGGPGEPTTYEGKVARRASEIYGGGLSFGVGGVIPAAAAGFAGETTKALGGGPLLQATAEIGTMLLTQGRSAASALTSKDPAIKARIDALRAIGYTDQDITLAINSQKAGTKRVKGAKATGASEKAFEEALGTSERLFEETLENAFPGYGKGTEHLHEVAGEAYGKVAREAKNVAIKDPSRFQKTVENVVQRVKNTLGDNPEAAPFLKRLEDASLAAAHQPSADTYINFYKELNKMGKWLNPKEKEIYITHVKNGIKSTFRNAGPEGKVLAEKFEQVNKGIQKAYQAEAVSDLIAKSTTEGAINWKKMLKSFDKQKTWDTLEAGLGKQQTQNLHKISKLAKDVGDFHKKLGSGKAGQQIDSILNLGAIGSVFSSLWTHNPKLGVIGVGAKIAHKIGKEAYARLQTKLLTDPKYQNISIRALEALKAGSPEALQRASNSLEKALQDDGYSLDDFK